MRELPRLALEEPAVQALLESHGQRLEVPGDSFLLHEGGPAEHVYVVVDGILRVIKYARSGNVSFVGLRHRGAIVGELAILTGTRRTASLRAVSGATAVGIERQRFLELVDDEPAFRWVLIESMAGRLNEATSQIHGLMSANSLNRICARLLQLTEELTDGVTSERTITLPISQQELGEWAGVSRASATEALRTLRSQNLISTSRLSVRIRDVDTLRSIAEP